MGRKIAYWVSTSIAAIALLLSLSYLSGSEQVVAGFTRAGYPQQLRIVLGLAKPAAAIVLLLPRLALLKEWAYVGVAIALVMAFLSSYSLGDGPKGWSMPLVLLALLIVSYLTRPLSRRLVKPPAQAA
jgi:hypothetical protein